VDDDHKVYAHYETLKSCSTERVGFPQDLELGGEMRDAHVCVVGAVNSAAWIESSPLL
jgi:hypothetical protein